jgi:hypothetical protein
MSENLILLAGKKALSMIRSSGLHPNNVKVLAAAAGGPKWLILGHLDRMLFSSWFKNRTDPLFVIGSSSGAWRLASACQSDPDAATDRFQNAYIRQCYDGNPSPADVSFEAENILNQLLGKNGPAEILRHPFLRLNIMTVRSKGLAVRDEIIPQQLGLIFAALCNGIRRKSLGFFFERALFYDPRDIPPFMGMDEFPIRKIPLTEENIRAALLASGSIPLVMRGVKDIPGAPPGIYRDGGVTDYHPDIPFIKEEGIVLFQHYTDRIIPGWLDKKVFWRKPAYTDHVLLVSPSKSFLERLPYKKIPDRTDFYRFKGQDSERMRYWNQAVDLSKALADEFTDMVQTGRIKDRVKPMPVAGS